MKKILFISLFYIFGAKASDSQPKPYFWINNNIPFISDTRSYQTYILGTQNGLPSSEITSLVQDSNGFLWIGTSAGLSRFDGSEFINFLKADNLFTGKIYAIKEDTIRKIIWIACDGGLFYFDKGHLRPAHFTSRGIPVYDIAFNKKNILIATASGPAFLPGSVVNNLLAEDSVVFKSLLLQEWKNALPAYKIYSDKKDEIYIGAGQSLYIYNNHQLEKLWSSTGLHNNNDRIIGMVKGNNQTLFFATVFSGIFSVKDKQVTYVSGNDQLGADFIKNNGDIYYLSSEGIFEFSSLSNELKKRSEVPEYLNIWASCLLVDNENNFWIGMHDNLLYQKPRIFSNYHNKSLVNPELYSIYQKRNNQLLFGANRGKVYKREGNGLENIFNDKQIVTHAEIKSIFEDSRGWLWLGTGYEGIAVIKDHKIIHFTEDNGLCTNSNYFFYEDSQNAIYTGGDGGVSKIEYDSKANSFQFKNYHNHVPGAGIETFKNCITSPDNTIWLAGRNGFFYLKNDSLIPYTIEKEVNIDITNTIKDKTGNVWLATKGDGIWECYFDSANLLQLKKKFTTTDGLLSDIYLDICVDHENNIWVGGYSGIASLKKNNQNYLVSNYTSVDGFLSSNYQSLKILCDRNDTIWVATSSGLISFSPSATNLEKKLIFNFLKISLSDTSKKISYYIKKRDAIPEIPYDLNDIELQYKAICLSDAQKVRYSTRLIGLRDTTWLPWTNKEVTFYQNLSPGVYTFEVRASLADKNLTKQIAYHFIILKPFWQRWWFVIPVLLLGVLLILLITKRWRKNIQKKNEEKIKIQESISENLQYRLEIEQVSNYFATLMSTSGTVDDLLWNIVRNCIPQLKFEDCVIYLLDHERNMLIQKAAFGPKSVYNEEIQDFEKAILGPIEIPVGKGITGTVALTGIAEIVPDVTKDTRYIKDDVQRFSEIAVPIIYDNKVLGLIDSENKKKNFYSQRHLQILTSIASHCAERIVKIKADEEIRKNEDELLAVKNRLAEEKLTALRSQMNPHFIFNSLNSVQQYILNGEVDNANKYLSKFSKLIRLVLQHSEYNFITLYEELNMLELYLSIEKTRFGNSFEYKILVADELDTEEIKIPNLMIQPFIENAIWHGLMHKEGERKIDILFHLKNDDSIVVEITDNGIGRKRAMEIKKARMLEIAHESMGMQLIKDKIDVLKQQFKSEIFIDVYDVTNLAGEVCGTKVIMQLPVNE